MQDRCQSSAREHRGEPEVHAFVFIGDVEEAAVVGDRDALDARQGWELADDSVSTIRSTIDNFLNFPETCSKILKLWLGVDDNSP